MQYLRHFAVMEAYYGEILTTCEKLRWIIANGGSALQTETRSPPLLLFLKHARVEYHPLGVIGIIIPWVCNDKCTNIVMTLQFLLAGWLAGWLAG
jgi:hypothetical protein